MNKLTIFALASTATALALAAAGWIQKEGSEGAIAELLPHVDRDVLKKAHKNAIKDALKQNHPTPMIDAMNADDEALWAKLFEQFYVTPLLREK